MGANREDKDHFLIVGIITTVGGCCGIWIRDRGCCSRGSSVGCR